MMLKKGSVIKGYKIVDRIAKGKNVFIVSKDSKEIKNSKLVMKLLQGGIMNDEIKIGMTLGKQCPYLVRILEVLTDEGEDEDYLYMIMEFCDGGDLSKRIEKNIPPSDIEIYRFVYEAAMGLDTLHKNNVIHRDIKPGNFFLITSGGFKLGDYGVACIMTSVASGSTMTRVGSEGYISPEILLGNKTYTTKTDIFSFGVTLLEFILGQHPFSASNTRTVNMQSILSGTPIKAAAEHPHPCAKLALKMIARDPMARPSTAEILTANLAVTLAPLHAFCVDIAQLKIDNAVLNRRIEELFTVKASETSETTKEGQRQTQTQTQAPAQGQTQIRTQAQPHAQAHVGGSGFVAAVAAAGSNDYLGIIGRWLGSSKRFNLLYKAAIDGFGCDKFHAKCDMKGPTVLIITSSEGYVFGGYTPLSWESNDNINKKDNSHQSFLFTLKNPRNQPPTKFGCGNNTTYINCNSACGPLLGGYDGWDINCYSKCTNLGYGYTNSTGVDGTKVFTGEEKFQAKDIEVYQVM